MNYEEKPSGKKYFTKVDDTEMAFNTVTLKLEKEKPDDTKCY